MSSDRDALLAQQALGTLPAADQAEADALLASSPEARAQAAELRATLQKWAEGLPAEPASPGTRARLIAALNGPQRFRPFFELLEDRFDLDRTALLALLARLDDPRSWPHAPFPDVRYFNFVPGPRAQAAEGGFVSLTAGAHFPSHQHRGHELAVVLQGVLHLPDRTCYPGDVVEMDAGGTHDFGAGPGRDLIFMVAHNGVVFDQ